MAGDKLGGEVARKPESIGTPCASRAAPAAPPGIGRRFHAARQQPSPRRRRGSLRLRVEVLFHFLLEHEFEASPEFELLHGMPHGLSLSACAELFGVKWHTANTPRDVGDVVADAAAAPVPHVIEVRTSREANHLAYNRLIEHLSRAAAS